MRRPPLLALLLALPIAAAGFAPVASARTTKLPAFDDCSDLVQFARAGVARPQVPVRAVTGFGNSLVYPRAVRPEPKPLPPGQDVPIAMPVAASAAPETNVTTDSAGSGGTEDFSTTNVQELGIDEPDVVKTDGKRLFLVVGTELWAYDVTGPTPKLLSKLSLEGAGGEILIRGDRILLLGPQPQAAKQQDVAPTPPAPAPPVSTPAPAPDIAVGIPAPQQQVARLAEIDARDASAMKIVRTMAVPGQVVSARLTKGSIRVILSSPATLPADTTAPTSGQATPATATRAAATKKLGVRAFVPRTTLHSRRTKRTFKRDLVPCDHVRHPASFGGLDLLTVLTVDFDDGLFNVDRDAVMAGAQVVYASEDNLYVASTKALDIDAPADIPRRMVTEIHRFDTTQDGQTTYVGSGTVPGFVLNQYALSEYQGDLRVATTEVPAWVPGGATADSESFVTVLRPDGRALRQIGQVSGLGKTERIYSTRFIADKAYVVTFRQVDPLYTVDLADPTAPKVAGELKISGYSAYLHPIGDDLLLGVGRDTNPQVWNMGAAVSIFDVKDPANPTRLAQQFVGPGGFAAEFDPHAFLWWPKTQLALLPYSGWDYKTGRSAAAAVGFTASRAGLAAAGQVTHGPEWDRGNVVRSVIVGDRVFTVSELGLGTNSLGGLGAVDFQAFVAAG